MSKDKPTIKTTSSTLYRKVTEVWYYKPTPLEMFFYYDGTNSGLNPNNPYAHKNRYSTRTYYEEEK